MTLPPSDGFHKGGTLMAETDPELHVKDGTVIARPTVNADPDQDLLRASWGGDPQAVKDALDAGANIRTRSPYDATALHIAARDGSAAAVKEVLAARPDPDAKGEGRDFTPLHGAAARGCAESIRAIAAAGANLEARNELNNTPLHEAAGIGKAEAVRALLECGADTNARGGDELTPLHYAAFSGSTESITVLLDAGADLEARDHEGWSSLHLAARFATADTVSHLLNRGADPTARDRADRTPTELARFRSRQLVVSLLEEALQNHHQPAGETG